jgi:hypothetical protein
MKKLLALLGYELRRIHKTGLQPPPPPLKKPERKQYFTNRSPWIMNDAAIELQAQDIIDNLQQHAHLFAAPLPLQPVIDLSEELMLLRNMEPTPQMRALRSSVRMELQQALAELKRYVSVMKK